MYLRFFSQNQSRANEKSELQSPHNFYRSNFTISQLSLGYAPEGRAQYRTHCPRNRVIIITYLPAWCVNMIEGQPSVYMVRTCIVQFQLELVKSQDEC